MAYAERLTCQQVVERVSDLLESALSAAEGALCESHLARCASCRAYVAQMQQTVRWLRALPAEPVAPAARSELVRLFRGWQRGWV
jgi:anti-sigma factor RsiW